MGNFDFLKFSKVPSFYFVNEASKLSLFILISLHCKLHEVIFKSGVYIHEKIAPVSEEAFGDGEQDYSCT